MLPNSIKGFRNTSGMTTPHEHRMSHRHQRLLGWNCEKDIISRFSFVHLTLRVSGRNEMLVLCYPELTLVKCQPSQRMVVIFISGAIVLTMRAEREIEECY